MEGILSSMFQGLEECCHDALSQSAGLEGVSQLQSIFRFLHCSSAALTTTSFYDSSHNCEYIPSPFASAIFKSLSFFLTELILDSPL